MNGKDPFGDGDGATVMRPVAFQHSGAGSLAASAQPLAATPPADRSVAEFGAIDESTRAAIGSLGQNPLLSAASPLLALADRVRDLTVHRDVESLRERVISELRQFETTAIQAGLTTDQIRVGRYALCATVDDVVLNTPWGSQSAWSTRSMVSTIHKETWGGERFFELLEQMQGEPRRYLQELELLYACLSLGFEGKHRMAPRGHSELARLRDGVYRVIRRERGDFERELSAHWRGVAERYRPLGAVAPLWVTGAVLAAVLMFVYMGFAFSLGEKTDAVYARMAGLLPDRPIEIARLTPPPVPAAPPLRPAADALQRIAEALRAEADAGLVRVLAGDGGAVVVRTIAPVFRSASDTVQDLYLPVIDKAARAMARENGPILVVGHTDSLPIRTIRFPSNQELSEARAAMVMRLMASAMGGTERLSAIGRGSADPIADNGAAEGREQNRRIEIILQAR